DDSRAADGGGSGLGLAIARGIARAHGGDLRCVEPPQRCGAAFELRIPGTPGVAQSSSGAEALRM
ncbi:MAG TPA: ATP-binding protein, partial [Pseudonocardia sp.]|nr:ATP-binding protein [Pseudonocardia sp.]